MARKTHVVTIKQLHDNTGKLVRQAGESAYPVAITDRGEEVAVIVNRSFLAPVKRVRAVLPEFAAMMKGPPRDDIQAALDEIRGDR